MNKMPSLLLVPIKLPLFLHRFATVSNYFLLYFLFIRYLSLLLDYNPSHGRDVCLSDLHIHFLHAAQSPGTITFFFYFQF